MDKPGIRYLLTSFLMAIALAFLSCGGFEKVTETRELMGTIVQITVYDRSASRAKDAIRNAFREMEKVDELMSTYKEESEVSRLNRNGYLKGPSQELVYVIKRALYYSRLSNGSFDITVQPLLTLYARSFKERGKGPSEEELKAALSLVGYRGIVIEGDEIRLEKKGAMITLGGIAKGYAIDRAVEALERSGIESALVNAGGDIRTVGVKPDGEKWHIALRNPRDEDEYITIIDVSGKAVATSGDYERYFDENKKVHHIINPKTGRSATELISVTIITEKAIDADALATSVFVLGPEKGLQLIESLNQVEGLLITSDRRIIRSNGFNRFERKGSG
jgi:thiamine biosynthesis lipoprotein